MSHMDHRCAEIPKYLYSYNKFTALMIIEVHLYARKYGNI